jgi:hypothetical protein
MTVIADPDGNRIELVVHKNSVSFLHRPAPARYTSYGYHIVK